MRRGERRWEEQGGRRLTCPADGVAGRGGEDLRGKVLKGHDLTQVLHNGLQIEGALLVAGGARVKDKTRSHSWLEKKD